jgi:hypothetical protein
MQFPDKTALVTGETGKPGPAVAEVVLSFASERARAVHGAAIPVTGLGCRALDGGRSLAGSANRAACPSLRAPERKA